MFTRDRAPAAILALILLVAFGLRVWSLGHGLPYSYNLDERAHFVPHAVSMTTGDLNPGYFINPPFLTYILAAWLSVIHLGGVEQWFADDAGAVFLAGRWISVFFGVGTVAATYFAGRAWFDKRVGLIAAAIIAVAFLPVFYSRLALNDGPGMLPCALALWASAVVLRTGSTKALLAGGAAVGLAASFKYSDGAVVIALVAAALLSPLSFKDAVKGLVFAGLIAVAAVIVTNPYLFADWGTFINDLDRQRKFAGGPPLLGQPERNGWWYYLTSSTWALGWFPGVLAVCGGIVLLVQRRYKEAVVLGGLVFLYWLYMGSQSRFYARWMLPLYPTLAVLAGYALAQVKHRVALAVAAAGFLLATAVPTVRNAIVMGREDTRSETRDWLVANVPQGTKVSFEPIAPTEWYGSTPGGGAKAHPVQQWTRFNRTAAIIDEVAARAQRGAPHRELPELRAHAHPGPDRRLPARGRVRDRHRLHAVRPRVRRAQASAGGAQVLRRPQAGGGRRLQDRPHGRQPAALPGRQVLQLRGRRLQAARAGDDRLPTAGLLVITGTLLRTARHLAHAAGSL